VQVNAAVPQSDQSTVSATFAQSQTAGNTNILAIGWNDATSDIASVNDSAGNTYSVAADTARGDGVSQAIWYAPGIVGGDNTVTVTFTGAVPYADIRIAEYAGLDQANPFDSAASATGTDGTASSGAVTTAAPGGLVFGAGITTGAFSNAAGALTTRTITSPDADILADGVLTADGPRAATAPVTGNWVMQAATFH
jgi:hypothetical protein